MSLISRTAELADACGELAEEAFVAVDTEFMRDRTYWPKLCLVQLGGSRLAVAVDPLAPGLDLAPLLELMAAPGVVKVFHAARQDLEIFWHLAGRLPAPLYDTQIAAMVCGFGEEVSYEALVAELAKARLDKTSRFTDWSRRPLTPAQLAYALDDVIHLRTIYEALSRRIETAGRTRWVAEELAALQNPAIYQPDPDNAWRRLKLRSRDRRFLALVQAIAAWREREAQRRDLPRNRVVRDDLVMEVAASRPRTVEALRELERVSLDRDAARTLVAVINEALALPESSLPVLEPHVRLPKGIGPTVDLLRVLLKLRSEESEVAQRLIASGGDLEAIAVDDAADVPALKGWRRDIFGADALALKRGAIALAVKGRRTTVVPLPPG
ncbi:MAG TPA: ribonuclease D [Geminicoccaceae bacterium]|nr:ribonuclease D [Geminicoccaceae bacterium]